MRSSSLSQVCEFMHTLNFVSFLPKITPKSMSVERSSSLFDPRFPTYVRALIVCGVILGVMWLVGAKFEFAKKMGWVKFRKKGIFSTKRKLIII